MTTIAKARVEQIKRVNGDGDEYVSDTARLISDLQAKLRAANREIERLTAELQFAQNDGQTATLHTVTDREAITNAEGRAVLTIEQYCERTGLHYMQVYRALMGKSKKRKIEGYQDQSRRHWVYAIQWERGE